ncbi:MAG: hypothetical protein ACREP1_13840 [Rhodanobacteraceae bacterium]
MRFTTIEKASEWSAFPVAAACRSFPLNQIPQPTKGLSARAKKRIMTSAEKEITIVRGAISAGV